MKRNYRFRSDRRTTIRTILILILCVVGALALYTFYKGGFFSAWFISLVLASSAFIIMSRPQRIALLDDTLEIQCVADIKEINIREIALMRRVDRREMRWVIGLFCSGGFFGYYGKYLDLKAFEMVNIYAAEWNNFVEITDIYDSRIYVSCREADELIAAIEEMQKECERIDREKGFQTGEETLTTSSYWE